MRAIFVELFIVLFLLISCDSSQAKTKEAKYICDLPFWNAPAESNDGIFTGDLSVDCSFSSESGFIFNVMNLRKKIIAKIQSESIVNQGPDSKALLSTLPLSWDASHRFEEDGNSIHIREAITLSIETQNQLKYKTHSKEISASGMASYLKSVEFTMIIKLNGKHVDVHFQNKVQVKRPWYALDLIFAPIARKICVKKLNQVKDKFMPWIIL